MAEKKPHLRDLNLISNLKDSFPDAVSVENDDFSREEESLQHAREEEMSFRSSMKETQFADRLVDSRSDFYYDYHGIVGTGSTFRFDVGNGFVLDYSVIDEAPSTESAVSILETVLSLVPLMKDGVEIEVDNFEPGIENACDGFKTRPPGNAYRTSEAWLFESAREKMGEFDDLSVYGILYNYCDPVLGLGSDGSLRSVEFYSVKYRDIHVLFPSFPTLDDIEWVAGIRPYLESLTQVLSRDKIPFSTHFFLWRDASGVPSDKTS